MGLDRLLCETWRWLGRDHGDSRRLRRIVAAWSHRKRAPPRSAAVEASKGITMRGSWLHRLLDHYELVSPHSTQSLKNAGRPLDFDVRGLCGTQAEVQALVVRREIASCSTGEAGLIIDLNAGAKTIAVAPFSAQRNCQPVQVAAAIQIKLRGFAKRGADHIDPAIVVQIAEGSAAPGYRHIRPGVCFFESSLTIQGQQWWLPIAQRAIVKFHIIEDVALNYERILPAVIVKIFEPHSPAGAASGKHAKSRFQFVRAEQSLAVVVKDAIGLVGEL